MCSHPHAPLIGVSTHMPLARHDEYRAFKRDTVCVSTHMPLARHDAGKSIFNSLNASFLLTCLLRGMTEDEATG